MKEEIKILKEWLNSDDNSVQKLREIRMMCGQIAYDFDGVNAVFVDAAVFDAAYVSVDAVDAAYDAYDEAAVYAAYDAKDTRAIYAVTAADARKKVQELVNVLEEDR